MRRTKGSGEDAMFFKFLRDVSRLVDIRQLAAEYISLICDRLELLHRCSPPAVVFLAACPFHVPSHPVVRYRLAFGEVEIVLNAREREGNWEGGV
jgi:hypothetical protein